MAEYKPLSVDEFSLLMRSIHREWVRDRNSVRMSGDSMFFGSTVNLFKRHDRGIWATIDGRKLTADRPGGFFNKKEKEKYDAALELFEQIQSGFCQDTVEELIIKHLPCAKDIIAETSLVEDGD